MKKNKEFIPIKYLKYIVIFAFFSLVLGYLYRNPNYLQRLVQMKTSHFLYLSAATVLSFVVNGFSLKIILIKFNIHLPFKECFGLSMANTMGNYLFTKAGTVANSYYLKKGYNLAIPSFIAMIGAIQLVNLFVVSLVGLTLTVVFFTFGNKMVVPLAMFYLVIFIAVLVGITFSARLKNIQSPNRIIDFILNVLNSWSVIWKDKMCITMVALLGLAAIMFFSFRLFICYQIIGKPISYTLCLLLATIISLSGLANLVPANIGLREGIVGLASKIVGSGFESGFFATVIDRIVSMFWLFVLGGIAVVFFLSVKETNQKEHP